MKHTIKIVTNLPRVHKGWDKSINGVITHYLEAMSNFCTFSMLLWPFLNPNGQKWPKNLIIKELTKCF